jgi:hypothetical protein
MAKVEADQLKQAVEHMHHCSARLVQSTPVIELHEGAVAWDGIVHTFDLTGLPKAIS